MTRKKFPMLNLCILGENLIRISSKRGNFYFALTFLNFKLTFVYTFGNLNNMKSKFKQWNICFKVNYKRREK